jgi:hypothetical protein
VLFVLLSVRIWWAAERARSRRVPVNVKAEPKPAA